MKKVMLILALCIMGIAANAQTSENTEKVKVYCEVMCVQYNLFKQDVNALVDFGIADKAKYANGWIYDSSRDKKYSFASPMSVFAYMAKRGWEYKDAIIITESVADAKYRIDANADAFTAYMERYFKAVFAHK